MEKSDYVMTDLMGYPYNGKYPPKGDKRGIYHGYSSDVEETLFYDFAVQGYDLTFVYKGKRYCFLSGKMSIIQRSIRFFLMATRL